MKFHGRLSVPKLDTNKFTAALEKQIAVQMRQAAREWLRAVIPKVPVWAGTSRGSLQPLGRFLRVAVPISPVAERKGQGPEVGASQGAFNFSRTGHRFVFSATTHVPHFVQNNFYNAPNPPFHLRNQTPWLAFQAGDEAFKKYITDHVAKRIPKIKDFISYKTKVIQ